MPRPALELLAMYKRSDGEGGGRTRTYRAGSKWVTLGSKRVPIGDALYGRGGLIQLKNHPRMHTLSLSVR